MLPLDEFCELGPAMEPITYECMGYTQEELARLIAELQMRIADRLQGCGFFQDAKMVLIVPIGSAIPDIPIPVAMSRVLTDMALLLTLSIGGFRIISMPEEMTYEDWLDAVKRGERPNIICTMPWAQARLLNWGVIKEA